MIGDKIKELRVSLGYSAEQVAAFLGVSPATIYRYENGDISKMPAKFVKPLADFLSTSPSELMGWTNIEQASLSLSSDETVLIEGYRDLSDPGKQYMLQQLTAAKAIYGEKELPSSAASTSESG